MSFQSETGTRPVASSTPDILEPMPREPVGRTFNVAGMAPGCAQVTVTVKDSAGNSIGGTPKSVSVGPSGYYSTGISLTGTYNGITINVVCTAQGGPGTTINGIDVVETAPIEEMVHTTRIIAETLRTLTFNVTFANHKGSDQSVVLVLYGFVGENLCKFSPHSFTSNPPKKQTYSYNCIDPGVYVAQFTFIDGQNAVTSRRFTYLVT